MLYFYPDADNDNNARKDFLISEDELRKRLTDMKTASDPILTVSVWKNPLGSFGRNASLTDAFLFYDFIIMETKGYYWSVEKTSDGVTIQRSQMLMNVKNKCRGEVRTSRPLSTIQKVTEAKGRGTVRTLVNFLMRRGLLTDKFALHRSSRDFAGFIFCYANCEGKLYEVKYRMNDLKCDDASIKYLPTQTFWIQLDKIYFDPEVEEPATSDQQFVIVAEDMHSEMEKLRAACQAAGFPTEIITRVEVYCCPNLVDQSDKPQEKHHYITLFETNIHFCWSFEKNEEGFTVQRARNKHQLFHRYRRDNRELTDFKSVKAARSRISTPTEVIKSLLREDLLHERYQIGFDDSETLAKGIFTEFNSSGARWT